MYAQSIRVNGRVRDREMPIDTQNARVEVRAIDAIDWLHDFVMFELSECLCVLAHAAIYYNRIQTHLEHSIWYLHRFSTCNWKWW